MDCGNCDNKKCYEGKDCFGIAEETKIRYTGIDLDIARTASIVERDHYMLSCRIEEIMSFAREMEYRKIGIAFCIGLEDEALMLERILKREFNVVSVCCKVGGVDKKEIGLVSRKDDFDATCNPIMQAELLNRSETDLNIIVGLCVGHDMLFTKHSKAPVTTLIVKDRLLGHNPVSALYTSYWRRRLGL
ncbi:MAG: hypothetical protein DRH49_05870 [Candidatus Coatesbacteria bacterium]|nr:MAG: hypothetical protein DRH49_05870 [Candidatus Coatesbacteria bacterium]